ncbi:MAG: hypothetical protein LBQ46_11980 [Treponema sp.]|jgi:putative GTP pyrophosphokinase|nr:hypothetical protein [Treponema sp.]
MVQFFKLAGELEDGAFNLLKEGMAPFIKIMSYYRCALMEVETKFNVKLVDKKDYITHPKESGYRSLHLIIETPIFLQNEKRLMKVEVQLRTIAMDFWASLEHKLHYKKNIDEELEKSISGELKICAEESIRLDLKMQNIQDRIGSKRAENG